MFAAGIKHQSWIACYLRAVVKLNSNSLIVFHRWYQSNLYNLFFLAGTRSKNEIACNSR